MYVWHVHHGSLYEQTDGDVGLRRRRDYIVKEKPYREQARRLRLMRPVQNQNLLAMLDRARGETYNLTPPIKAAIHRAIQRAIAVLHREECRKCPWDGKTIFPKKVK